jgi:hypothetical protein
LKYSVWDGEISPPFALSERCRKKMPRPRSGPRLWLDPERETYTVIDGRKTIRTGCGKSQLQAAKDFLAAPVNA